MFDANEVTIDELWELTTADDLSDRAEAMRILAFRLSQSGKQDQVEGLFQSSIDTSLTSDSNLDIARSHYAYSSWLNNQLRHKEALEQVSFAITGYGEELRTEWLADAIRQRAIAQAGLGNIASALEDYSAAEKIYTAENLWYPAAFVQLELVELLGAEDQQFEAYKAAEIALGLAQNSEDVELNICAHDRRAAALIDLGEYEFALTSLTTALDIAEHQEIEHKVRHGKYRVGSVLRLLNRPEEALALLTEAEALFRAAGENQQAASVDYERVQCLVDLGRTDEALTLARQLLAVSRAFDETRLPSLVSLVIAEAKLEAGDIVQAEEHFVYAQELAENRKDLWLDHVGRLSWATKLVSIGQHQRAYELIKDIPVSYWGQGRERAANHLATRAQARFHLDSDSLHAELDIQECLSLGPAIGLAEHHAKCYELWADIRRIEGRESDASTFTSNAIGLWLRSRNFVRAERLGHWLVPQEYLTRIPSTEPIVNPAFIASEGLDIPLESTTDHTYIDWELNPAFRVNSATPSDLTEEVTSTQFTPEKDEPTPQKNSGKKADGDVNEG